MWSRASISLPAAPSQIAKAKSPSRWSAHCSPHLLYARMTSALSGCCSNLVLSMPKSCASSSRLSRAQVGDQDQVRLAVAQRLPLEQILVIDPRQTMAEADFRRSPRPGAHRARDRPALRPSAPDRLLKQARRRTEVSRRSRSREQAGHASPKRPAAYAGAAPSASTSAVPVEICVGVRLARQMAGNATEARRTPYDLVDARPIFPSGWILPLEPWSSAPRCGPEARSWRGALLRRRPGLSAGILPRGLSPEI